MIVSHSSFRRQRCVRLIREYWCHGLDNCEELRFITSLLCIRVLFNNILNACIYILLPCDRQRCSQAAPYSTGLCSVDSNMKKAKCMNALPHLLGAFTSTAPSVHKLARVQEKNQNKTKTTWVLKRGALCNVIWKVDQRCCSSAGEVAIERNGSTQACFNRWTHFSFYLPAFWTDFCKRVCVESGPATKGAQEFDRLLKWWHE